MSRQTIRQVIAQRARVEELSQGEDYYEIEKCWKQLVDVVCEDLDEAIRFLEVDCTEDEFSWISEVLDDIARRKEGGRFRDPGSLSQHGEPRSHPAGKLPRLRDGTLLRDLLQGVPRVPEGSTQSYGLAGYRHLRQHPAYGQCAGQLRGSDSQC